MITALPPCPESPAISAACPPSGSDAVWELVDELERSGRDLSRVGLDEFKALLSQALAKRAVRISPRVI